MFILRFILYVFIVIIIFNISLLYVNTHLPRYPYHTSPSNFDLKYENVTFQTTDGIKLKGWFIPVQNKQNGKEIAASKDLDKGNKPVVIVCHGLGASKSDVIDFGVFLHRGGFNVLLFDFRGHGDSEGEVTSFGYREQRDLQAAIEYLYGRNNIDKEKIGLFGFSLGGAVAILNASKNKDIKAVVVDSVYIDLDESIARHLYLMLRLPKIPFAYMAKWTYELRFWTDSAEISPIKYVDKISPGAMFVINGELDKRMTDEDARRLYEKAKQPKELWIIPNAEHGTTYGLTGREYEERVVAFFNKYLTKEELPCSLSPLRERVGVRGE